MSILNNFLLTYHRNQVDIPKRDLLLFALSVLREADRLEQNNTGTPGKVAIEFILSTKYEIVENRDLQSHVKDLMLAELDSIINKVVAKYNIRKKGKNFYFKEDITIAIAEPAIIGPVGSDLLADLYAANTELQTLKIQLARTNLNSSDCLRVNSAILAQERKIKDIKLAMIKQKCFSHVDDQKDNNWDPIYRRALGENRFKL